MEHTIKCLPNETVSHREHRLKKMQDYYVANREEILIKRRILNCQDEVKQKNKEKIKIYYEKNKALISAKNRIKYIEKKKERKLHVELPPHIVEQIVQNENE